MGRKQRVVPLFKGLRPRDVQMTGGLVRSHTALQRHHWCMLQHATEGRGLYFPGFHVHRIAEPLGVSAHSVAVGAAAQNNCSDEENKSKLHAV